MCKISFVDIYVLKNDIKHTQQTHLIHNFYFVKNESILNRCS